MKLRERNIEQELKFSFSPRGGPGGQHVNKTSTQVELRFHVPSSECLSGDEKRRILQKLKNRITQDGEFILTSSDTRSQMKNRDEVLEKFYQLLEQALHRPKKRKPTKPSKTAKKKRLEKKKQHAEKKSRRKPPSF